MTSNDSTDNKDVDIIESSIGTFGRWQIYVCLTIFMVKFSIAWHQLGIVFLAPNVDFKCSNSSYKDKCDSHCPSHDFDKSVFEETIVTEWDLVCDREQLANVAQLVFMFGILIGNVVFGYLSDRFGRRNPLVWAVMVQVGTGVAAAFAPSLWLFIVLRFFCAMATGGTMLTSFVLVMEIVGKKYRTVLGVLFQIPFNLGHATLGLFGYYIRNWTYFQMAISVPSIILVSYYWLIPESPRWLLTVGRTDDAIAVMQKAAKHNRLPTYSITEKVALHLQESKNDQQVGGNVLDLVKTSEMRIRTICIFICWTVIGLDFFGVAQYVSQISGDIFLNVAIAGLIQVPGTLLSIYMMDKMGRKWSCIIFFGLVAVPLLIVSAVPEDTTWVITTLSIFSMLGNAGCFSIIYVYGGELYPTTIRNVGLGAASMFARFGSMTAPFVASLKNEGQWLPPLIFGIFPLLGIAATLPLPETLNRKLPDTIEEARQVGMQMTVSNEVDNQGFDSCEKRL